MPGIYNDPRVARFLSVDPISKSYPELTPYQFASNRPIDGVDLDGLEWEAKLFFDVFIRPFFSFANGATTYAQGTVQKVDAEAGQRSYQNNNVPQYVQENIKKQDVAQGTSKQISGGTEMVVATAEIVSTYASPMAEGFLAIKAPGIVSKSTAKWILRSTVEKAPNPLSYGNWGSETIGDGIRTFDAPISESISITEPSINEVHIFMGEINRRGRAVGFHSAQFDGFAAKILRVTDGPNSQGVYRAEIQVYNVNAGTWESKMSTMFPSTWNKQKVLQEIKGAYKNADNINGNKWSGVSPSGVRIEGYLDGQGAINTAYPKYE